MKDITVIIPVHDNCEKTKTMLNNAVSNVKSMEYDGVIKVMIVIPETIESWDIEGFDNETDVIVKNNGETDYCSQINLGVSKVETEYFSIMEYDDRYNLKWFKMFNEYLNTHEDYSMFLPVEVVHNVKTNEREFINDIVWASSFSSEIGHIDFECLENTAQFNLTGGVFKTSDWLGYKPSIEVFFNYEYLLRASSKKQLIYVVPKEGYYHSIFRDGSLISEYSEKYTNEDVEKWFELAKREYSYASDRNKGISATREDELK